MFVKLHRPPPEINIFFPAFSARSSTTTFLPRFPASSAHISPAAPAPSTTTSNSRNSAISARPYQTWVAHSPSPHDARSQLQISNYKLQIPSLSHSSFAHINHTRQR